MSFSLFYIRIGFILSIILVNVVSQRCRDGIYCTEGGFYWCCQNGDQCGMNMGACFSQNRMDHLLIIGGSLGGAFLLCCLGMIGYCIRSSHIKEREAEKARYRWAPQLQTPTQMTQPYVTTRTTPISFSNPIPLQSMSSINVVSQPSSATPVPAETSSTHQSAEYKQMMKYLITADQLLQRDTINTQAAKDV